MVEKPVYQQKGGGAIGLASFLAWGATYPLSRLKIFKTKIELKVWPFNRVILLRNINSFSRINTFLGQGIIFRVKSDFPYLAFWSWDADPLEKLLLKLKIKKSALQSSEKFIPYFLKAWKWVMLFSLALVVVIFLVQLILLVFN